MVFLMSLAGAVLFGCVIGASGFFFVEAVQRIKGTDVVTGETKD